MLPAYRIDNALVNFQPVNDALQANTENALSRRKLDMEDQRIGMERERLGMARAQHADAKQEAIRKRIGGQAIAALQEQDPARLAAAHQSIISLHPNSASLPAHYRDNPRAGLMAIIGDAGLADDYLKLQAQIEASKASAMSNRAHAGYYSAATRGLNAKADAASHPAQSQPLQEAYGMTEDGQIVPPPAQRSSQPALPAPINARRPTGDVAADGVMVEPMEPRRQFPAPMKLGGPMDDIDASMRLDEGRPQPRGVQVAQAGAPITSDGMPTLMERYRGQTFGRAGMQSPEVPGVVTTPKGVTDVPATREAAGQRAFDGATPEQQERYRRFRQEQQLWTSAYGGPPRAGYYYGPKGEELAKSDRVYKGDKEARALLDYNMKVIDEAHKKLIDTMYPARALAGTIGYGETARALSDLEGAATQIAFTISGKSVSNAERKEFMDRFAPKPTDSEYTINHKVGRMKQFYRALIDAQQSGVSEQQAWDIAKKTSMTTPLQESPAKGLSDDELLKELNK